MVVDTSRVSSDVNPRLTSLLDASCVPIETDGARALYSFSLDSCGTSTTVSGPHLYFTASATLISSVQKYHISFVGLLL